MCGNHRGRNGHRPRPRPGLRACAGAAGLLTLLVAAQAQAQTQIIEDGRTSVYASSGVNLPSPVQAYGQDEVQAAGGVACRSAVGGSGPYVDAGVVGSQDLIGRHTTTAYARLVVPIGRAPARVDCTRLYDLEIQRLRMELQLARMNLPPEDGELPVRPSAARVTAPRSFPTRSAPVVSAPVVAAAAAPVTGLASPADSATTVGEPVSYETPGLRRSLDVG